MLHDGQRAVVVDPGDAAPVVEALNANGLALAGILVTHHHADHVGGVDALRPMLQGAVYGPARERIPMPFDPVVDGQWLQGPGFSAEVMDVPGHTAGHVAYLVRCTDEPEAPILFCGDTLFSGGCGRLFEGTPAQMHASLVRLGALPGNTRVCCAHEYTLSNLRFAAAVEPANALLADYTARCEALRAKQQPTLPSTLAIELDINPFMRCALPSVIAAALQKGAANDSAPEVLGALRAWKNQFR